MGRQFGVIISKQDNMITVLFEGTDTELFKNLDIIKNTICENAEIKLVDKEEYDNCKENITELNKLLRI